MNKYPKQERRVMQCLVKSLKYPRSLELADEFLKSSFNILETITAKPLSFDQQTYFDFCTLERKIKCALALVSVVKTTGYRQEEQQ